VRFPSSKVSGEPRPIQQLDLGNPGAAIVAAEMSLQLSPKSSRGGLFADLGNVYEAAGNYSAAAKAYQEALSTRQTIDSTDIYSELAQCYINANQFSKALVTARTGIKNTASASQFDLQIAEATALAELNHQKIAKQILESVANRPSTPANVVTNVDAMLSALGN
jgi:tetratricopeptide (TPR) repeat protein